MHFFSSSQKFFPIFAYLISGNRMLPICCLDRPLLNSFKRRWRAFINLKLIIQRRRRQQQQQQQQQRCCQHRHHHQSFYSKVLQFNVKLHRTKLNEAKALTHFFFFFFLMGQSRPLFLFIFVLSTCHNLNSNFKLKKA